jgi:two-component system sensor histidine kinase KdpD
MFNIINKKIEIKYSIKPIHEWVIGDQKHIQHVLINLLSNAVKFSKKNTKIIIRLEAKPIVNKKQGITISVIDENNWIPPNIKKKLFQKYVTSDNVGGTGLGLYICRKIIELHGGTITHDIYRGIIGSDKEISSTGTAGNIFKIELDLEVCVSVSGQSNQ